MFCSKCGAQISDGSKFCGKCGTPVMKEPLIQQTAENGMKQPELTPPQRDDSTEIILQQPSITPINNQQPYIPTMDHFQEQETEKPEKKKKQKKQKRQKDNGSSIGIICMLVFLILILFGAIGFIGYRFLQQNSADTVYAGYLKQAEDCMDEEDYEGATGYYIKAIDADPTLPDAYEGLAKVYQKSDDLEKAQDILQEGYDKTNDSHLKSLLDEMDNATNGDASNQKEEQKEQADEKNSDDQKEKFTGEKKGVNIEVHQVDNSNFPEMTFYASVTDESGNVVENLDKTDFNIQEIDTEGNVSDASINDVYKVLNGDNINVNLVLDKSGSMSQSNKMQQAKNAANTFIQQMELSGGDKVEVISFDSYVYLEQEFTRQQDLLTNAIDGITEDGQTALYDALYAGLYQTYYETGAKCVIGFTDGMENASSYSFDDVVNMAQNTGIPVFIIGIGEEYDANVLRNLATECSGKYYSANVDDLQNILEDIYLSIYQEQQEYYVFKYTSDNMDHPTEFRDIVLETSETTEYYGSYRKSYVPQADVSGAFQDSYMDKDFILDFTDQREVTDSDLNGLSLAELRIARNEIFARHGRQFKDSMLNQWFYSKTWYLNVGQKYAPNEFDAIRPSPLSAVELKNTELIKNYENAIMNQGDIYPNASSVLLSDYDLALSKAVLKTAYSQMQGYSSTSTLEENKRLVQEAMNKEEVQY